MLFVIVGLVLGIGGYQLGNYLLNDMLKSFSIFLGGLFVGAGIATHPQTQAMAKKVELKLTEMEAKAFGRKSNQ